MCKDQSKSCPRSAVNLEDFEGQAALGCQGSIVDMARHFSILLCTPTNLPEVGLLMVSSGTTEAAIAIIIDQERRGIIISH